MLPISERNARTIDTQINFTSTMKNLDTTYSEIFFSVLFFREHGSNVWPSQYAVETL